jgi:hypothetical protein
MKSASRLLLFLVGIFIASMIGSGCQGHPETGGVAYQLAQNSTVTGSGLGLLEFFNIGDCIKCELALSNIETCLRNHIGPSRTLTKVAMVRCRRDVELKMFSRQNPEFNKCLIDYGSTKADLHIPADTRAALINAAGDIVGYVRDKDIHLDGCRNASALMGEPSH